MRSEVTTNALAPSASARALSRAAMLGIARGLSMLVVGAGCAPSAPVSAPMESPSASPKPDALHPTPIQPVTLGGARPPKDCCRGRNVCKGMSGCRGAQHDCKGKNDCKGTGTACDTEEDVSQPR